MYPYSNNCLVYYNCCLVCYWYSFIDKSCGACVFPCLFIEYRLEVLYIPSAIESGGSVKGINVWFLDEDHIKVSDSVIFEKINSGC